VGISIRYYLFPEDAAPQRIPLRVADGLVGGTDTMPQFANTRQRILTVVLDVDGRSAEAITRFEGTIWTFDGEGSITEGLREAISDVINSIDYRSNSTDTVVAIGPEIAKRKLAAKHRWKPSQEDLDAVLADVWPDKARGRLKAAKGSAPKRPPLTWEGKDALRQATEPFWKISFPIDQLKEPSLAGLVFEARDRAEGEPELAPLYEAIAKMADRRLNLLRARRSSKGIWYACADILRWEDEHTASTVASYHVRCDGRAAAVQAARRLMTEHADKFSADCTIDVSIETELEWEERARMSEDAA